MDPVLARRLAAQRAKADACEYEAAGKRVSPQVVFGRSTQTASISRAGEAFSLKKSVLDQQQRNIAHSLSSAGSSGAAGWGWVECCFAKTKHRVGQLLAAPNLIGA